MKERNEGMKGEELGDFELWSFGGTRDEAMMQEARSILSAELFLH
jgi:hypothetical protein